MNAAERRAGIVRLVETNGRIDVEEVAYRFGVSVRTARRDLNLLAARGLVQRSYGGASSSSSPNEPKNVDPSDSAAWLPVFTRARLHVKYKDAIGKAAAAMVSPNSHIIIDAGTTAFYVARHLSPDLRGTVLTNGLLTADELAPRQNPKLSLTGGVMRAETYSLVGPQAIAAFQDVNADICFIGATGVHLRFGLTTSDVLEANVKRTMMRAAARIVLVADYSKFGQVSLYRFARIRDVDVILTDKRFPLADIAQFEDDGVKIIRVG